MSPVFRPLLSFTLSSSLLFGPNFARSAAAQNVITNPSQPVDTPPSAKSNGPQKKVVSFAKAIAAARLTRPILVLALEGDEKEMPELPRATVEQVAVQYGKITQDFGWVQAIGPERTVQLETNLGEPNLYAGMSPGEACTLLMNLFTDAQRSKAMSTAGIGLSDLTEADQKELFKAILPKGKADYELYGTPEEGVSTGTIEDATKKFANAKLRLGQDMIILAPFGSGDRIYGSGIDFYKISDSSALCELYYSYHAPDEIEGAKINKEVPNRYKIGNLDVYAARFRKDIMLEGLNTVAELVERIRKFSGVELYADAHYEKRKVILKTGKATVPMSDLLRALAFCVGGTYRQVGPAYVLTEDLKGVGTRRQIIKDFEELGAAMRYKPVRVAENSLMGYLALQKTPPPMFDIDKSLNPTPEQEKQGENIIGYGGEAIYIPYEQLNTSQKATIDAHIQAEKRHAEKDSSYEAHIPNLSGHYTLIRHSSMQLLASGFDYAFTTSYAPYFLNKDFRDDRFDKDRHFHIKDESDIKKEILAEEGAKLWRETGKGYGQRGLIARPHSREEVDKSLREAQDFGLNQLWLVVFEEGKTLLPGTDFPQLPALKDQPDLLAYAIEAAKKANIRVCPVVELFAWGSETPDELRGRTLRGEDSLQYEERHYTLRKHRTENVKAVPPPPSKKIVWADPLNPEVQKKLGGLLRKVAAYSGIGNVVWNSEFPYRWTHDYWLAKDPASDLLEYNNKAVRLAYLRQKHLDPIDGNSLTDYLYSSSANLALPQYNSDDERDTDWQKICDDEMEKGLRTIYTEMEEGLPETGRPSVLLMQGKKGQMRIWYNEWSVPTAPLPEWTATVPATPATAPQSAAPAKKPVSLMRLALPLRYGPVTLERKDWPVLLGYQLKQFTDEARKWDGFVLAEGDLFPEP